MVLNEIHCSKQFVQQQTIRKLIVMEPWYAMHQVRSKIVSSHLNILARSTMVAQRIILTTMLGVVPNMMLLTIGRKAGEYALTHVSNDYYYYSDKSL